MTECFFSSKILLFGEYAVLLKKKALAIPYSGFKGQLALREREELKDQQPSEFSLEAFVEYLETHAEKELKEDFDFDLLKKDKERGLVFKSKIPQGYGVGSSGALCAAFWHRYAFKKERKGVGPDLKNKLSLLENFFHGSSSGFDPLVSFIDRPVILDSGSSWSYIEMNKLKKKVNELGLKFFLLDSTCHRKNSNLIKNFLKKVDNPDYGKQILSFARYTENCIDFLLGEGAVENRKNNFLRTMEKLSRFQKDFFQDSIPENINRTWNKGLKSGDFFLKLCGAGGGGFYLGITAFPDKVLTHFNSSESRAVRFFL